METSFDPNYIEARETLLDAVETLEPHSNAVILVGAQAVYVHTESEDESFAVAPFTYDADIALDPGLLEDSPLLVAAMSRAGFRLHNPPGLYRRDSRAQVDLLVPNAVGGPGRRGGPTRRPRPRGSQAGLRTRGRPREPYAQEDRLSGGGRGAVMHPEGGRTGGPAGVEGAQARGTLGGLRAPSTTAPQGCFRHLSAPAGHRHSRAG